MSGTPGFAQGISPDQIQQLQQQYQSRQGATGAVAQPAVPQDVIIQPVQPEGRAADLPPSRLEKIMSARAGVSLDQFGYDQFGSGRSVTVPQTGAVQDDYILGPNDEIVVTLRGQESAEYRAIVDRNGQVILPRLSPLSASGRSFGSFRQDLEAAIRRSYVATSAFVSVGRMRQINVLVSGEVTYPGQRLVTGLSSAVDALLLSGGIKKTGSLRNVRILRGGHDYIVDLYSVLTGRGALSRLSLADGDRIVVPPLGRTVAVTGLVRQPGIFELSPNQSSMSVSSLLALAGGQEVRGQYRLSVLRINADGRSEMAAASPASTVNDSEILFVQLGADLTTSQATLSGSTGLAGTFPVAGMHLSAVLKAPGALGAAPYTPFGIIVRKDPQTLLRKLVPFTPVAVLDGTEDQVLQADDFVRVFTVDEVQMLNFVTRSYVSGVAAAENAIRNPTTQISGGNTLTSTLNSSSGQTTDLEDISNAPAEVQRQVITGLLDQATPGSLLDRQRTEKMKADADAAAAQQTLAGTQTRPADGARGGPAAGTRPVPSENPALQAMRGNLPNPSPQPPDRILTPPAQNFIEQSVNADQFASNLQVQTFGELSRQLGIDPLVLANFLVDRRVRVDGAVRAPGSYLVGPNVSLKNLVQAAGGTINWADESGVELISTAVDTQTGRAISQRQSMPLGSQLLSNYTVRPRDKLRFASIFTDVGLGSVTIQGEVRHPGAFPILRGEHLSDLLARAGGLTNSAYPYGTVFLRQSTAQSEREGYIRAANEIEDQLIVAMTRVGNDKLDPATFASMQTFVAELRNQTALGRVSIVADPSQLAAKPELDPLLETNDVIYIPQRPSTISVLGQVLQPGSYPYQNGRGAADYVERAGGYARTADEGQTFVVFPDGSARKLEKSWLSFSENVLPPGSAIVVPRDVTPLDLRQTIIDVSQIFSQFAVAIASVAVLSKQ